MKWPSNRVLLGRLAAIVVSGAILCLAASRIDLNRLIQTLATMRPGWFLLAVSLNGLLFLLASLRWHLVLMITGQAVNYRSSLRAGLAGHFFYVGLFGAMGGDSARSVYYARWFDRPLPAILATAPLDRLLGLAGLLIFGTLGVALALSTGGLPHLHYASKWGAIVWLAVPMVLLFVWWTGRKTILGRQLLASLAGGFGRLARAPRQALLGVGCGFLVQAALSGILALNLMAVSHAQILWVRVIWAFPVISLLGGLPITVAGLGTREAAAIALLGMYGVPPETAMAASLLSLLSTLLWAFFGAVLFWREDRLRGQLSTEVPGSDEAKGSKALG